MRIPRDLRVVRVESPGLTDWSRPADDLVRLRFDAESVPPRRTIRLDGWIPVDGDPMATGPARSEAEWPWPSWRNVEVEAGSLTVSASANVAFRLDARPGLTAATTPACSNAGTIRASFAVAPLATPGRLRWTVEPTGVNVRVQSLLTLHPDSAEWTASARYQIPWGPCPPIRLRLPTAWADAAQVEIVGSTIRPQVERSEAETTWTFRPDPPIWGNLQVLDPREPAPAAGGVLAFPDLLPLGRPTVDRVESYLGYADASGRLTVVEGSTELQPVDASRWDAADLPWPAALPRNVLRVVKDGWSLRFQSPGESSSAGVSQGEVVGALADLHCTLREDGLVLGRASYDLDGPTAGFLTVNLPEGAEALGANVDGAGRRPAPRSHGPHPRPPARGGAAARSSSPGEVRPARTDRRAVPLPCRARRADAPLLTVSAGDDVEIVADATTVSPAEMELIRAERKARAAGRPARTVRSKLRAPAAALLGSLVRFELQVRSATRAAIGANEPRTSGGSSIRESLAIRPSVPGGGIGLGRARRLRPVGSSASRARVPATTRSPRSRRPSSRRAPLPSVPGSGSHVPPSRSDRWRSAGRRDRAGERRSPGPCRRSRASSRSWGWPSAGRRPRLASLLLCLAASGLAIGVGGGSSRRRSPSWLRPVCSCRIRGPRRAVPDRSFGCRPRRRRHDDTSLSAARLKDLLSPQACVIGHGLGHRLRPSDRARWERPNGSPRGIDRAMRGRLELTSGRGVSLAEGPGVRHEPGRGRRQRDRLRDHARPELADGHAVLGLPGEPGRPAPGGRPRLPRLEGQDRRPVDLRLGRLLHPPADPEPSRAGPRDPRTLRAGLRRERAAGRRAADGPAIARRPLHGAACGPRSTSTTPTR